MFPRLVSSWRWPWHERGNNQLPFLEIYPEDLNSRFEQRIIVIIAYKGGFENLAFQTILDQVLSNGSQI